ncbi:uncharacterized protein LOC100275309 [Zea mays]|uniref:Uncharacterized protein n=1 Tax=Zea mays TaxID=4577 RepID=B6SR64_MAIZE|nr:uncharacterized protein LOC100275309 [Zea mays]ACG27347.1 hypothetical protein [Zea mays]ACG34175.1 hypothetical protein [Zea mays]|eukprot:NP_001315064.1 uncharacterized protein LOC100275309 [Zea mays]
MPSLWPTRKKRARGSAVRSWSRRRGSKKSSSSSSLGALWRRMVGPRRGTRTRTRTRARGKKPGLLSRAARVLSCGRRSY